MKCPKCGGKMHRKKIRQKHYFYECENCGNKVGNLLDKNELVSGNTLQTTAEK